MRNKFSLAIPSSLFSGASHLREKTVIIGQIARTAAIYRVSNIYIYRDNPNETKLIKLLLSYIETPQYLRKHLFKRMEELSYAGVLPPLRTPHHPIKKRLNELEVGDFREGVVLSEENGSFHVDIGVEKGLIATGKAPSLGSRATTKVTDISPVLRGVFIKKRDVDTYWGYEVHAVHGGIEKMPLVREFDLKIATSRHGKTLKEVNTEMRSKLSDSTNILIAFGSPRKGLIELTSERNMALDSYFDLLLNAIPCQGTETIRTEEAIHATLAIINTL